MGLINIKIEGIPYQVEEGLTILEAAKGARKRLRQVEYRLQSPDHPYLMGCPESHYLKFFIYQVFEEY